ncbi:MAG: hypothetical protein EA385_10635 [Salinarimonadaceae bacterium]|nr:MAG: hypothetical protein EA385_10635 [Salinarimonadaceae bacterium]
MNTAFLDPQSTAGDFHRTLSVRDVTTGEPYDLASVTAIAFSLRLSGHEQLRASLATGEITIDGDPVTGRIAISLPVSRLRHLRSGAYSVGVALSDGSETVQLLLGTLPIVEGHPHELA